MKSKIPLHRNRSGGFLNNSVSRGFLRRTSAVLALATMLPFAASAQVLVAGWGDFDSNTAPNASVVAPGITGTAVTTVNSPNSGGNWSTTEGSGRGESNDATWGSFSGPPAAPTTSGVGTAIKLNNARMAGDIDLTITNAGPGDYTLESFHFDAYAFRAKAARTYEISIIAGDLTNGVIFTSDPQIIPANGSVDPAAHVDYDHSLTGLADNVLAAGESVTFRLAFSGGADDNSGGHHLFVDNIAVSSVATTTDKLAVIDFPMVDTAAGTDFSVTVQAQDSLGDPLLVSQDTDVSLVVAGSGTLTGISGTIPANSSSVILPNVQYDIAETITVSAIRTSGDDLLSSAPSGSFNIIAGAATDLTIETANDGSGEEVGDTLLLIGEQIDVFAISRDVGGNFVANETSAVFSLINITGNIMVDDLLDNNDGSANFEAFDAGTCNINAAVTGFTDAVSGLITTTPLVNRYDGGNNDSPNMSNQVVWLGDTLPDFNNQTDLFFSVPGTTKRSLYLGPVDIDPKSVRSITFDEATTTGQNISFVENGTSGTVNLTFDTDSLVDPAELNVDAAFEALINFGATNTSQAEAGDIILADNLLITHNGTGLLDLRVDVIETGGSYGITKSGTGTAVLSGANTYTGDTTVTDGVLRVTGQSIADSASLVITGGKVDVESDEYVAGLSIPGMPNLPMGEYGHTDSGVAVPDDTNFSGSGKIIVGPPPVANEITITDITRTGTDVTITFTSTSNVDVYRSSDMLDFGASPYASNQPSGTYTDTAASGEKFFYILVSTGDPAP